MQFIGENPSVLGGYAACALGGGIRQQRGPKARRELIEVLVRQGKRHLELAGLVEHGLDAVVEILVRLIGIDEGGRALGLGNGGALQREGAEVRIITREQVRKCFADSGLRTRHEIAVRVAAFLREISVRLPDKRKVWETEKPDAALMNSAALLIVHYANPREPL